MHILIDTNIIINLEDNKILEQNFSRFIQLATSNGCNIYFHKDCEKDILNDKDLKRKQITLSKLRKYTSFPNPAEPTKEFIEKVGQNKHNDEIDNKQLFQAYLNYTDLFVTNDNGILKKAVKLNLSNVINVNDAAELLADRFTLRIPQHPLLEHLSLRDLVNNLENEFFDSLRIDYNDFDKWFAEGAKNNRQCYVFKSNEKICAILIYKEESASGHRISGVHDEAIKMCTFKVAETTFGNKIGELFLSKMISLCIEKNIPNLYLTVFEKHIHLINLLESFGFSKSNFVNKDGKEELIYLKKISKVEAIKASNSNDKLIHPFYYDNISVEKYVVPIQDKYYRTLFKDGALRQSQLFDKDEASLNEIQGNTITKAYICASPRKTMKEGSILFFYSSKNKQMIEPVGILESLSRVSDYNQLKLFVSKRTVFTEADLEQMLESKKELTVLLFRLVYYIKKPVTFKTIKQLESFSNKFTSITTLKDKDYQFLKANNYFDERYIIN
jgi:L-amino acid N-acyltransferase YncA